MFGRNYYVNEKCLLRKFIPLSFFLVYSLEYHLCLHLFGATDTIIRNLNNLSLFSPNLFRAILRVFKVPHSEDVQLQIGFLINGQFWLLMARDNSVCRFHENILCHFLYIYSYCMHMRGFVISLTFPVFSRVTRIKNSFRQMDVFAIFRFCSTYFLGWYVWHLSTTFWMLYRVFAVVTESTGLLFKRFW